MYYNWKRDTSTTQYFEQITYRLKTNKLPIDAVQEAFKQLVARHTILRTSFTDEFDGTLLQIVHKTVAEAFEFEQFDGEATTQNIEAYVKRVKAEDNQRGFALNVPSRVSLLSKCYPSTWT